MKLGRRRDPRGAADAHAGDALSIDVTVEVVHPRCAQCGRTDYPIVAGWDPPVCADCDAATNEEAIWGEELDG